MHTKAHSWLELLLPASLGIGVVVAVTLVLAACGGSSNSSGVAGANHSARATVATRRIAGLGTVLVNSRGQTLYAFAPDRRKHVTCRGSCTSIWHPLLAKKAVPGGSARKSLLGADMNPGGGDVVTYAGWPLYTYVGDSKPGEATGQGKNLNGGVWHVLSPAGSVIRKTMSGGSGGSGSSGGGGSSWG